MYSPQAVLLALIFVGSACSDNPAISVDTKNDTDADVTSEVVTADVENDSQASTFPIEVRVTLDGVPSPDTRVVQGGQPAVWWTDADGVAQVDVDLTVPGELVVIASHPEARIKSSIVLEGQMDPAVIALKRFDTSDNEDYVFKDPGEPGMSHKIEKCGHCHVTINDDWFTSAHKSSASNPVLQDIYAGTAAGFAEEALCIAAGGSWEMIQKPGTDDEVMGCVVEDSVSKTGGFGGCADCHAPAIDGKLGGRDLHEAKGYAYDYGVHCEVCHHTESVDMDAAPGVAGRLKLMRPSEEPKIPGLGDFNPLTFCPNHDVPNLYMGCVQRDHFRESKFCGACHELDQKALMPDTTVDTERWPSGKFPVHSTFSEWEDSAFAPGLTCQGCHMPPAGPEITNGADLQLFPAASTGIAGGWPRPPGSTKRHTWAGPKSPEDKQLAAPLTVKVEKEVSSETLTASITLTNASAGHAIPTGDPLGSVLLVVDAHCGETDLQATGGDVIPDYGGALAVQDASGDWTTWPGAEPGQKIRVITVGEARDYSGYGPFGDGTFTPEQKGLKTETFVSESTIVSVEAGVVVLDKPLPEGSVAYRVAAEEMSGTWAGYPGFGFARVLVDDKGKRMVPHFMAVDAASDLRLMPSGSWTTKHVFNTTCEDPSVRVRVIQRAYPRQLAFARGWPLRDRVWVDTVK